VLCCRLLTYLTAVSEYCAALSSDLALCHSEPLCQVILLAGNATVHVENDPARATAADWWQALTDHTRQECWPDWLRIFNQECQGSKHAQVKQCLGSKEERATNADVRRERESSGYISKAHWACPKECILVFLEPLNNLAPSCLPPWLLRQVCGSGSCEAGDQQQGGPLHCRVKQALLNERVERVTRSTVKHDLHFSEETCSAAVEYASSAPSDFHGSCPHVLAVAQLVEAVPEIFTGHDRCSVQRWVSAQPGENLKRDQARLCDMWPPPAFAYDALPKSDDLSPVFYGTSGNGSAQHLWTPQTLTQAALLGCASGFKHMHDALSTLWTSPQLYGKLLQGSGSWMRALPRAGQVCRELCVSNSSQAAVPAADVAWGAVEGALHTYCTAALASSAAQQASPSDDGSTLGCADALHNLKRNWYQHQLLAIVWLVFLIGLLLGLLALYLLRTKSEGGSYCCKAPQGMCRAWSCLGSRVKGMAPSYHPTSMACDQDNGKSCCIPSLLLSIIRACWFVAEIAMDVGVLVVLEMIPGVPPRVYNVMWYIVVLSAPAVVTMLLAVPSVMSAYGVLDFARVRFSLACSVLLFFSFAWLLLMLIVGVVGGWFIVMADMYMLVALCGVPHHKLMGNKLNMGAYTTLRFMCQGLLQGLPSALICTAVIDAMLVTEAGQFDRHFRHVNIVFWASLLLSMSRFAWEVLSLAALTHRLQAPCFVTAIVDVVHHLQPQQASSPCEVTDKLHDTRCEHAGLASLAPGQTQAPLGAHVASTGSRVAPCEQAASSIPAEKPPTARAGSTATAMQLHSSPSAGEGASCCSSWGTTPSRRTGSPQLYPSFTVVYVWVVSLLVGAYMCVVCSHFIWPWLAWDSFGEPLSAASNAKLQPYSLLGLWGNWRLSGSAKGSLKALGACDVRSITCNLTAPSFASSGAMAFKGRRM